MGTKTMRRLGGLGAAALLVAAGCGGDDADQADEGIGGVELGGPGAEGAEASSSGFEATPGYLSEVVDASTGESYRYEMTMEMDLGGDPIDFGGPIATGEFDGTRNHMQMDMGAMFAGIMSSVGGGGELPNGLPTGDLTIEYVTDTDAMYMRAPFFAAMFGELPAGTDTSSLGEAGGLVEAFGQLGDGWGKVDLTALGDVLPSEAAASLGGGQAYDPAVFLEMLRSADGAEELGTDEIDGDPVSGLSAEVSMADMVEAQGMSPDDLGSSADVAAMTFPLEVWVDADDHIRRIHFSFDEETLAEAGGAASEEAVATLGGVGMTMTMDFADYGDSSIEVEVPADDEVVDITDDFVAGYESIDDLSTGVGMPS